MNFECKYSANFCNIHDFWTHVNLRFQSVGCQAAECIHYFWYWPREQWDLVIHICMKCHLLPLLRTNTICYVNQNKTPAAAHLGTHLS